MHSPSRAPATGCQRGGRGGRRCHTRGIRSGGIRRGLQAQRGAASVRIRRVRWAVRGTCVRRSRISPLNAYLAGAYGEYPAKPVRPMKLETITILLPRAFCSTIIRAAACRCDPTRQRVAFDCLSRACSHLRSPRRHPVYAIEPLLQISLARCNKEPRLGKASAEVDVVGCLAFELWVSDRIREGLTRRF